MTIAFLTWPFLVTPNACSGQVSRTQYFQLFNVFIIYACMFFWIAWTISFIIISPCTRPTYVRGGSFSVICSWLSSLFNSSQYNLSFIVNCLDRNSLVTYLIFLYRLYGRCISRIISPMLILFFFIGCVHLDQLFRFFY